MQERAYQKELLDDLTVPFEEIQLNMRELNFINTWLGGHSITIEGMRKLMQQVASGEYLILEIGCGGGDNLKALSDSKAFTTHKLRFAGVDINPACINYARTAFPIATYYESDYRLLDKSVQPAVIFSSLFCHHFTNEELVTQLRWMYEKSRIGFVINDLHRHPLAYWSIRILTALFSRSRLVRHDAPLSVKRGFKRKDWQALFQQAGITEAEIQWRWAFRWLITVKKTGYAGS
ncbi:MAG: methyltransferase domain-containing protein [Flavipsychrobacter sp.]|nr:methyltransferase domain-containing protein [Flavipsychrobacter sp.]